jgi:hypothetical protein
VPLPGPPAKVAETEHLPSAGGRMGKNAELRLGEHDENTIGEGCCQEDSFDFIEYSFRNDRGVFAQAGKTGQPGAPTVRRCGSESCFYLGHPPDEPQRCSAPDRCRLTTPSLSSRGTHIRVVRACLGDPRQGQPRLANYIRIRVSHPPFALIEGHPRCGWCGSESCLYRATRHQARSGGFREVRNHTQLCADRGKSPLPNSLRFHFSEFPIIRDSGLLRHASWSGG